LSFTSGLKHWQNLFEKTARERARCSTILGSLDSAPTDTI